MDPKVIYWTAALANLTAVVACAGLGWRRARQRDFRAHRRLMLTASWLVLAFLGVIVIGLIGPADRMDVIMGRVPGTRQPPERGPLAGRDPTLEQDDGPLAMHDLGSLQARQTVLQRSYRCIRVAVERFPPFKFR